MDYCSSSKGLKMDASLFSHSSESYEPIFPYSMGTLGNSSLGTLKPGLLGIAPLIPGITHMKGQTMTLESLTPRQHTAASNSSNHSDLSQSHDSADKDKDYKPSLYQQLAAIEQSLVNKTPVHISQLLALFTDKQVSTLLFVILSYLTFVFYW